MTDQQLVKKIREFENNFIEWAKQNNIWHDSNFSSYLGCHGDEPNDVTACILVLTTEGPIFRMLNGYDDGSLYSEFEIFMDEQEFYYELYNHYTIHFFAKDETLNSHYLNYFEWQWITELIKPDYTNLYSEIFQYFEKHPEKFYNLHHRKFEVLIREIFTNQGFQSVLGPGKNDGGVDVRLFENNGIDQILTLVQVKKYKPSLPIKLEAVAALSGIVHTDNADGGLFVSTSGYAPVAKRFAARKNSKIILADSADVSRWCETTSSLLMRDKTQLFSEEHLMSILQPVQVSGLVGQILVSNKNFISADFYLIVKDTLKVSLIMLLPHRKAEIYDSPYETRGTLLPITDRQALANRVPEKVFRATKSHTPDGTIYFRAEREILTVWDRKPVYFDFND